MFLNVSQPSITSIDKLNLIIAVAALLISAFQWIGGLFSQRFHISVSCTGYSIGLAEEIKDYRNNTFGFIVNNHSSLPISINSIQVLTVSRKYKCFDLTRRFMKEHFIPPGLNNPYQFFTSDFPVKIDAYSSVLIYATFETKDVQEHILFDEKSRCSFKIITNRRTKRITIPCQKTDFLTQ